MNLPDPAELSGWIGASGTALAAFWKLAVMPTVRSLKRVASALEAIEQVRSEFTHNGGSTVKDKLDRIEVAMMLTAQRSKALTMDAPYGVFEATGDGLCTDFNRTYRRWAGLSTDELAGTRWLSCIHPDDRDYVYAAWKDAISQQREFSQEFKCVHAVTKDVFSVHVTAYPIFESRDSLVGWLGVVHKVDSPQG